MDRAFDVLAEMRAELHPIDPDHVTVGALMKACASAGQVLYLAIVCLKFWSPYCLIRGDYLDFFF